MASCNPMPNVQKESISSSSSSSSITPTYTSKLVLKLRKLSLSKQINFFPMHTQKTSVPNVLLLTIPFPIHTLAHTYHFVLETLNIPRKLCRIMSTMFVCLDTTLHFSTIPSKARFYFFPLFSRIEVDGLMEFKYQTQVGHIPSKHEKTLFLAPT